jgi:lipopolysaccharide biosynthesis glycosyltransferase
MTATKNCILLVSDQEYLKYFYPLIYSIKRNVDMDDVAVRMHFINVTAEHADFIVDNFPNASITFETKSLSEEKIKPTRFKEMPKLLGNFISEKHAYCNNKRYEILDLLLSTNYKNVLYMDVDHLVRGDLNPLFQLIANHDIIVHKYPQKNLFIV